MNKTNKLLQFSLTLKGPLVYNNRLSYIQPQNSETLVHIGSKKIDLDRKLAGFKTENVDKKIINFKQNKILYDNLFYKLDSERIIDEFSSSPKNSDSENNPEKSNKNLYKKPSRETLILTKEHLIKHVILFIKLSQNKVFIFSNYFH
jgi:hypothetical protein